MAWTARDERTPEFVAAHPGSGGNVDLVEHMTSVLADRSRHITVADNWFTCVPVVDKCTEWGMGFLGAMKHFRGTKAAMLWPVSLLVCLCIYLFVVRPVSLSFVSFVTLVLQKSAGSLRSGAAQFLFHAEPVRRIQQWVDAKTTVTIITNDVAKCVRGSPEQLFAREAKFRTECKGRYRWLACAQDADATVHFSVSPCVMTSPPPPGRVTGTRPDRVPHEYVLKGGVGRVTRRTKASGDEPVTLPCPVLTMLYQTFFRGVDRADAVRVHTLPRGSGLVAALTIVVMSLCVGLEACTVYSTSTQQEDPPPIVLLRP
jgi:hypothetical protein